jgi:hypothetical protein
VPIAELAEMIVGGKIKHALILMAFTLILLKDPEAKAKLAAEMRRFC